MASLRPISGVASSISKFQRAATAAIGAVGGFSWAPGAPNGTTLGMRASYGARFGLRANAFHIRIARWSVIAIGGSPSRSSIVATIPAVSYWVESIAPVWVYGLMM